MPAMTTPPPPPPPYGHPQPTYVVAQQPPTSGLAVASLIFGILGLVAGCCTFGIFSVVAVLCGHAALRAIRDRGLRGDGMAKAGLVMGYLLVVPMLLVSIQMAIGSAAG